MDLKVNYGSFSTASNDLNSGATAIQSTLNSTGAELQRLRSDWEGDVQETRLVAKQQRTGGMADTRDIFTQISTLAESTDQSYSSAGSANAARFS